MLVLESDTQIQISALTLSVKPWTNYLKYALVSSYEKQRFKKSHLQRGIVKAK